MHVFIITQYYPPEIGASASRWSDYIKILIQQNHKVSVLCEAPHYPNKEYFPGFSNAWLSREEKSSNLTIFRTKAFASDRKSFLKKITHYFVFMISAILNFKRVKNYDLLIISSPPLFTGIIGLVAKKFYKKKFWLDIRDLWPDSVYELGQIKKGFLFKLSKNLERKIYDSAEGFIFPVPGFRKYLQSFSDIIAKKPMYDLMNGVSKDFIDKYLSLPTSRSNIFTVLYSGNMGLAQDLETIIKAAEILKDYDINFTFIGQGVCKSKIISLAEPFKGKINFYDSVSREELVKYINKASVCIVPLKDRELFKSALPSKMFEYMACERPVIVGIKGEAKKLINNAKAGVAIEPENPETLSKAILTYYNNKNKCRIHGENGLRYVTSNLSKEVLISKLISKLKSEQKTI